MLSLTLSGRYSPSTGTRQDAAAAEWNGQRFEAISRHGATMAVARQLVAAGAPDQPWQAVAADGRALFSGPSLHRLAAVAIHESDADGPDIIEFGDAPLAWGCLDPDPDAEFGQAETAVEGDFAPMPQPQVGAIIEAIEAARAYPVPVFQGGRVNEIAIWRNGQWFGSVARDAAGGLTALDQTGAAIGRGSLAPAPAVTAVLRGATKTARKPAVHARNASPHGADASPGRGVVAPPPSKPLARAGTALIAVPA